MLFWFLFNPWLSYIAAAVAFLLRHVGMASLSWHGQLVTYRNGLLLVTHTSIYRDRRKVTSLNEAKTASYYLSDSACM